MEYQETITILKSLLDNNLLDDKEKEAAMTSIGILSWGALSISRLKTQKAKRDKSTGWEQPDDLSP